MEIISKFYLSVFYQHPFTYEGHMEWIITMINTKKAYQFIICSTDTDEPIGCTYLRDYNKQHNYIEYGIYIGESNLHGKGIGTQATLLTLHFAFYTLNVHRCHSKVLAKNALSNGMVSKLNWRQEALLKDDVYLNGQYQDVILYGVLASEFIKVTGYYEE